MQSNFISTKRRFCVAAVTLVADGTIAPTCAFLAGAVPQVAKAWVAAALAVAGVVVNLIAANNRTDGGMGAMLNATLEMQMALSNQVASLQIAMARLINASKDLKNEIRALLHLDRLQQVTDSIAGVALGYQREMTRATQGNFASYQEWQRHKTTRLVLAQLYADLNRAFDLINQGRWFDATTAAYLPLAASVALGLRTGLGDQDNNRVEAQAYVTAYNMVLDDKVPGSAAARLVELFRVYDENVRGLHDRGFEVPKVVSESTTKAEVFVVRVRDQYEGVREAVIRPGVTSPRKYVVLPRFGAATEFLFTADVKQILVPVPGAGNVAIRQFAISRSLTLVTGATSPALTEDQLLLPQPEDFVDVSIGRLSKLFSRGQVEHMVYIRTDAQTLDKRRLAVYNAKLDVIASAKLDDLGADLDALNSTISEMALCMSTLATISGARKALLDKFRPDRTHA